MALNGLLAGQFCQSAVQGFHLKTIKYLVMDEASVAVPPYVHFTSIRLSSLGARARGRSRHSNTLQGAWHNGTYIGVILGLYGDNGKENGNTYNYIGFRQKWVV